MIVLARTVSSNVPIGKKLATNPCAQVVREARMN